MPDRATPRPGSPRVRLAAYAMLAGVGALQWGRYVEGSTALRPLLWVLAGTVTGALLTGAQRLEPRRRPAAATAAAAAGLLLAVALSGLELRFLAPRHWDELASGVAQGAEALNSVRLPYLGRDPWVLAAVDLAGAGLCWAGAVAASWPPGRPRLGALVALLVLAASPVVSIGSPHPVALGLALAVLTAAFLWAERLPRRPGLGLAALAAATLVAAVPLGAAADREEPWFDYRAFSENFAGGRPIAYDWDHGYGPIDWPREGAEVLRVRSPAPLYWKAAVLDGFDGLRWVADGRVTEGVRPSDDLPANWRRHPGWNVRLSFALKRLRTPTVVGAGTILAVRDATQALEPDILPGTWVPAGGGRLGSGDSYTVRAHVPRPTPAQLAAATVGRDRRRLGFLTMHVPFRPDALAGAPRTPPVPGRPRRPLEEADVSFAPFEADAGPTAHYRILGIDGNGAEALARSRYERTWALARRLRSRSTSPYDYLLRVNQVLHGAGFRYSEVPPPPAAGEAPLESFLFDTRLGYCQQYSGAMALLLRMGGIPARVATGFSPGGLRRSTGEWIVRDTDAHSWVEAWFDGLGWVTFDPTPAQTPARSQVAAIRGPQPGRPGPTATPEQSGTRPKARNPEGLTREATPAPVARGDRGTPWPALVAVAVALLVAALALVAGLRARADARRPPEERALRELERALRRAGRSAPPGTTLEALERRLGVSAQGSAYLRALRRARYGGAAEGPTAAQRAAFRRELASGLGWRGRLVALWALPPRLYDARRRPR